MPHTAIDGTALEPLALYVHWPFCLHKCPYCDFNSHVRARIDQQRFRAALLRELAWEAARLGRRRLASIFFGGGTPSLMAPDTVAAIIDAACRAFAPAPDIEITLEANPTSVEAGKFLGFRDAGVNRISIGVQALDDRALAALGRQHSAEAGLRALAIARENFARVSFDMIYARPAQSVPDWQAELLRALAEQPDHLSLYQLTIEPGTQYATRHARGEIVLPDAEQATALYDATTDAAARHGLAPYEVSNYAKPGAESRHNLAYWRYQDYAGIGPGAHGRVSVDGALLATRRHRGPEEWAARVEAAGHGITEETAIEPCDRARENLLMGLRLAEGIDAARFLARTGIALDDAIDARAIDALAEEGYVARTTHGIAATAAGRLRLDALLPLLVR